MRAREGDVIEAERAFFNVKGLIHPPGKVIASLHFLPDPDGERRKGNIRYRKIPDFSERRKLLRRRFPQYLVFDPVFDERLCELPIKAVQRHHRPCERLRELRCEGELDEVERQALSFIEFLKASAGIPWRSFGISGSILVGLHTLTSDIDPIVYGTKSCFRVYSALRSLLEGSEGPAKPHGPQTLKRLFEFRSKDTTVSFEDFIRTESRKVMQGEFLGRNYSIKFVKDWDEVGEEYGSTHYSTVGYAEIRAKILDDSEAIFTPCRYEIEGAEVIEGASAGPIEEIASFRPRFCEQARRGEIVAARGKVERVSREGKMEYYRLVIGNKSSDFMILAR